MMRFNNIPKVFLVSILLAFTLFPSLAARRPEGQYRVMTCNIRITGLEADDPYPERVWESGRSLSRTGLGEPQGPVHQDHPGRKARLLLPAGGHLRLL